jgi:hypothetical protein
VEERLRIGARRMSENEKRKGLRHFEKAAKYDVMANYYKYLDPNLHIHYYKKHLAALGKAFHASRTEARSPNAIIRFLHASTDAGNIDVYINAIRIFKDLPYKQASRYLSLPQGKYHIDIYPAGNPIASILNKRITVEAGKIYTLAIVGAEKKLRLLSFDADRDVPKDETKMRFIHLSPNAPAVDIAVVKGDVVFPRVSYKEATKYLPLTPMTVDLEIRKAGTKQVLLPLNKLTFMANEGYSLVLTGAHQGEWPLEAFLLKE